MPWRRGWRRASLTTNGADSADKFPNSCDALESLHSFSCPLLPSCVTGACFPETSATDEQMRRRECACPRRAATQTFWRMFRMARAAAPTPNGGIPSSLIAFAAREMCCPSTNNGRHRSNVSQSQNISASGPVDCFRYISPRQKDQVTWRTSELFFSTNGDFPNKSYLYIYIYVYKRIGHCFAADPGA